MTALQMPFPEYRTRGAVFAVKVIEVEPHSSSGALRLAFEGGDHLIFNREWVAVNDPRVGGYCVYSDYGNGLVRAHFEPAEKFELDHIPNATPHGADSAIPNDSKENYWR